MMFWMSTRTTEGPQDLFELGRFIRTDAGWRYHSGQKLTREDFQGTLDELTFGHFDQASQKIIY